MRRVDQPVRHVQPHRELPGLGQVAAPPAAVLVVAGVVVPDVRQAAARAAHALHEDQPVRLHAEDGVAGPLGGEPPVAGGVAAAPAGAGRGRVGALGVRLVVQVGADHGGVVGVPLGHRLPVVDPGRLGDARGVPERRLPGRRRPVPVQDDPHPLAARVADDLVQDLQRGEPDQVRVDEVVDPGRGRAGLDRVVRVRDAQRVVAQPGHGVELAAPGVARPQAVERLVVGLHAEPVDAGQPDGGARAVDDLVAAGVQVAGAGAAGSGGGRGGADGGGDEDAGRGGGERRQGAAEGGASVHGSSTSDARAAWAPRAAGPGGTARSSSSTRTARVGPVTWTATRGSRAGHGQRPDQPSMPSRRCRNLAPSLILISPPRCVNPAGRCPDTREPPDRSIRGLRRACVSRPARRAGGTAAWTPAPARPP